MTNSVHGVQRPLVPGRHHLKLNAKETGVQGNALIVDDNFDLLELAAQLFKLLDYDVLTARSGEIALDILKREPGITVLFSDVVMPGISGVQLGVEAALLIPDLKVILVSGYPTLKAGVRCSVYDFAFVDRPYQLNDILHALGVGH